MLSCEWTEAVEEGGESYQLALLLKCTYYYSQSLSLSFLFVLQYKDYKRKTQRRGQLACVSKAKARDVVTGNCADSHSCSQNALRMAFVDTLFFFLLYPSRTFTSCISMAPLHLSFTITVFISFTWQFFILLSPLPPATYVL